ncbi:protein KRI1 homolog [Spodoptera litura]|uniref:Protein KRI1 homolog n=1 Tax=Spodoptera litura TaxID=69820 RepID=A0A9J7DPX3_SPOLT|nr:protein KRI1 homolog [Spodoptera litura]
MPKPTLFDDDSDEEVALKTENEYAKKYDKWREKEELHKLEQKYGSKALNSDGSVSSDSEDESDSPPEITEEMETQFLKTLALLKTKDPRIYDPQFKFFDENQKKEPEKETKTKQLTFADSDDDDDDDDDGNIFSVEKKAEVVEDNKKERKTSETKEGKLKEYLTGQAEHLDDAVEKDLAPLKALWSDPKLNEGEAFLRDYILNKKHLFQLKRFPRTMNYIRPKDDRRSKKRQEVRTRKEEEKKKKMEEIARLKALKLKEIQEKIAKIKEVTGNEELAFREEDLESEFDPEEHDKRMREIFDEEYYGDADEQKPVFPDLDEELEIENWEKYQPEQEDGYEGDDADENGPHCEDEDFNMDAEYDPKKARENLLEEVKKTLGKKRRNRKKKSKLAELLSSEKPKFVPTVVDKTYDQYMEEYYKMDCEDVIGGDLPTRFKYREVVPCDYGLTVEEILLADDKELTQWVPLKKILKHRPENVEKGDARNYAQKAADVRLKKKILPSLFKDLPEDPEIVVPIEETKKKKKKKKKKNKEENTEGTSTEAAEQETPAPEQDEEVEHNEANNSPSPKKKKKDKNKNNSVQESNDEHKEASPEENGELKQKKKKKKHKEFTVETVEHAEPSQLSTENNEDGNKEKNIEKVKKNLKRKADSNSGEASQKKNKGNKKDFKKNLKQNDKFKKKQTNQPMNPLTNLSDERLKAYGLNPKKYKNFMKFKKF